MSEETKRTCAECRHYYSVTPAAVEQHLCTRGGAKGRLYSVAECFPHTAPDIADAECWERKTSDPPVSVLRARVEALDARIDASRAAGNKDEEIEGLYVKATNLTRIAQAMSLPPSKQSDGNTDSDPA